MKVDTATTAAAPARPAMGSPRAGLAVLVLFAALGLPALAYGEKAAANHERDRAKDAKRPPNVVFILCDNLGYGDIGCFGGTKIRTPHVDRLAQRGMRLTHFYSASGVCTPSRAALMTGCYPRRVGLHDTQPDGQVLRPISPNGLAPAEVTIAEVLKQAGYATACIGKWHLGDQMPFLPTRQGFDLFYGIPYSDDMTPRPNQPWPDLPLMRNEQVVEAPVDRNMLTHRYTKAAIAFIREHRDEPFFLYLPHAMPGSTRRPFASRAFQGRSQHGPYGDSVEELDWSTGQIMDEIDRLGLAEQTLIVWTSDNGAPRRDPPQGSNDPLAGWGYTTREGGMRVPCIAAWPGHIPSGSTCEELTTMMDWLPTLAALAGVQPEVQRAIDGHDIRPLLRGEPNAKSPYEAFYYYHRGDLQAVRSQQWKLYVAPVGENGEQALYDVASDPAEQHNLYGKHPQIVSKLTALAERARKELGDGNQAGSGQRPVGRVERPTPRVLQPAQQ